MVFHLPDKIHDNHMGLHESSVSHMENRHNKDVSVDPELGLSDDLLKCILLQLRSYLIDTDVDVIQLAYKTLKVLTYFALTNLHSRKKETVAFIRFWCIPG